MQGAATFIPAAHYHALTPLYEAIVRPFAGRIWRHIALEAAKRSPQRGFIVDLGCGPGSVLRNVRALRADLTLIGTDIDPAVIRIARNRAQGKNITFEVASMERQPLQSQSCDVALSALMFHHLPPETKRAALHEVRRILKPNGVFLLCDFSTPVKRYWWLSVEFWQRIEPEVKPQIEGQLFTLAQEANASIETLQTFYGCIALHLLKFRDGA